MNCCSSIEDLGCIYSCDTIQIGINTPTTGTYTIELQPDGIKIVSTENTAGTPLVFPGSYLNEDGTSVFKIIKPDGTYLETVDGEDCFSVEIRPTTNAALANVDIQPVACADATAVLRNSVPTVISTTTIASGASANITAPDATAVLKNSAGTTITTNPIPSNVSEDITAPDATAVIKNSLGTTLDTEAIPSNVSEDIVLPDVNNVDSDGSVDPTPAGVAYTCTPQVKTVELFFAFEAGDDTSALATNSGTTWTLTAISDDGASGAITVSDNGAAYGAFANPTTIANGETIQVKRATTTGAGWVLITGTYA